MKNFITSVYCWLFFSWYKIYKTWRFRYENHYGFQELSWTIPFIYHELYFSVHGRTLICVHTSYTLNGYTWYFHINTRTIKLVLKTCFIFFYAITSVWSIIVFSINTSYVHNLFPPPPTNMDVVVYPVLDQAFLWFIRTGILQCKVIPKQFQRMSFCSASFSTRPLLMH